MTAACVLHQALGRQRDCPGEACALWEDGCTIAALKLDLRGREDLAAYLLEVRHRLERLRED